MNTPGLNNEETAPARHPQARSGSRKWVIALTGIIILACGIAMGVAGTVIVARRALWIALEHPERVHLNALKRLKNRLDLREDQTREAKEILARRFDELLKIRNETQPRVAEQLKALEEEIAAILDSRQEQIWRKRIGWLERLLPPPSPSGVEEQKPGG